MHQSQISVAVLVLNWNGKELLPTFLPSWLEHTPDSAELIVVDNGSIDGSVAYLRMNYPEVRIIELGDNYGFSEGYNRAIEQISHDVVVLLNSDVALSANWLAEPIELLERDERIAAVQPKIRSYREPECFEYAGAAGGYLDRLGYPFCRGRIFDEIERDRGQYDSRADLFWASGACLIVRRKVYLEVGGLDTGFFAHQEEIDLSWRLLSRGYRIVLAPRSVVYHLGGGSLAMNSPRKTYLNFRNNLLMLYKNLPGTAFLWVQLQRLVLDMGAALWFVLKGRFSHAWAVFRAYGAYLRTLPSMYATRTENITKMTIPLPRELKSYSLVYRYYLRGQRTYTSLEAQEDLYE